MVAGRLGKLGIIRLGTAKIDFDRMTIEGEAGRFSVEPKVLRVLQALLDRQGEVVSREDLIDQVWGVGFGGDERLSRAISLLRKALGDRRGNHQFIKTIPKRGYRLRTLAMATQSGTGDSDRSLAVLRFKDLSPDASTHFLADGLCQDLTNMLSRVPNQRVAPYTTAVQFEADKFAAETVARELKVRHLAIGTFSAIERDIRLRVSVVDAVANQTIWSEKYHARLDQFFEVQEEVVQGIATAINSEVEVAALKSLLRRPAFDLTAYEHIQAAEAQRWAYSRDASERIITHLRSALDIEPRNPLAHAALTVQLAQNVTSLWTDNPAATFADAREHLKKAQALSPNHPEVLTATGILASMDGRADLAVPVLERAVELDPNNPHSRALYGWQLTCLEREPEGVDHIRSAERDAPHHPRYGNWVNYRGYAEFRLGNLEASLRAFEDAAISLPTYYQGFLNRAHPLVLLGRMNEATAAIREAIELEPRISLQQHIANVRRFSFQAPPGVSMNDFVDLLTEAWPE